LSVGIHGEEAVGRRTEVTALVTAPAEITQFISFSGGNIRIGLEGIALPDFAVPFCTFPIIAIPACSGRRVGKDESNPSRVFLFFVPV